MKYIHVLLILSGLFAFSQFGVLLVFGSKCEKITIPLCKGKDRFYILISYLKQTRDGISANFYRYPISDICIQPISDI